MNMDFVVLKIVLMLNSLLVARGAPIAMLQHATSSQSFVIHQPQSTATANAGVSLHNGQHGADKTKYEYKYEVSDHQTGDRKSHWETRDGDRVRGVYTLYEPDGALRRVEYTADAIHGFNAIVSRNGQTTHHPPSRDASYSQIPPAISGHDGYGAGYIPERSPIRGDQSRFLASSPDQSGTGFNVNHALDLNTGNELGKHY